MDVGAAPADHSPTGHLPAPAQWEYTHTHVSPHAGVGTDTTATSQSFPSPRSKQELHGCVPWLLPAAARAQGTGPPAWGPWPRAPRRVCVEPGASFTLSTPGCLGARILVPGLMLRATLFLVRASRQPPLPPRAGVASGEEPGACCRLPAQLSLPPPTPGIPPSWLLPQSQNLKS